ncbi:RseA family anti-sigma factor [Xanthomonas fragariae]|uniref:RseA family anti-sigma factor n=1 Tax=Xanthomonas fragariae TaxID=48664 RepID=UPI000B431DBE|nr:sigma-E factor negative regulatory protein [Xanthomonas fragariae]
MRHNPAMSTTDKFELHYRQQLSALVDGELNTDESRFLLRRLAHDEELAGCHERWQLCGDVLRGAASAPAPSDFAARVRSAIAVEPVPQEHRTRRPAARWRWGGGAAIAASVAAIALFIARERLPQTALPASDMPVYATAAQMPAASQVPVTPVAPKVPVAPGPATPDDIVALAAAAPAAALASTRRGAATRNQQVARSVAWRQQQTPTRMVATATPAPATVTPAAPSNPFTHSDTTLQPRPWPRAALSGAGERPLDASVRQSGQGAAFYPFEPAPQIVTSPALSRPLPVQLPQN